MIINPFRRFKNHMLAKQIVKDIKKNDFVVLFPHKIKITLYIEDMISIVSYVRQHISTVIIIPQYNALDLDYATTETDLVVCFFGTNPAALWRAFSLFFKDIKNSDNSKEVINTYIKVGKDLEAMLTLRYGVQLEPLNY